MFNHQKNFLSLLDFRHPIPIRLGDGKIILSTQGGPVELQTITIQALYVPSFRVSLLSVSKLGEKGLHTNFEQYTCTIKRNQQTLLSGKMEGGIYILQTPTSTALVTSGSTIETWHRRLAHLNPEYIRNMILPISKDSKKPPGPCSTCILTKHKRAPQKKTTATRATQPFELIHSDSCTITTPSLSGALYYLLFIDDYTRWTYVYFLSKKNSENCTQAFKETLNLIHTQHPKHRVQRFRSDNGTGEYDNQNFRKILTEHGIIFEPSPAYTPNMNGVSERMVQALNTRARSMMIDGNIPISFWAEMINTATYIQKRTPTAALKGQSPYEALYNEKPPLQHLRRIGCVAYHRIPNEKFPNKTELKFGKRSKRCMMVGYTESTKIWKLWDPSTTRMIRSTDVIFIEEENALQEPTMNSDCFDERRELEPEIRNERRELEPEIRSEQKKEIRNQRREDNRRRKEMKSNGGLLGKESGEEAIDRLIREIKEQEEDSETLLRLYTATALNTLAYDNSEPRTFQEALNSPQRNEWINGIRDELRSLLINQTWEVIPVQDQKTDTDTIDSKWVFKIKINPDNSIRYKARLVVKGYRQIKGVNYEETYAPVSHPTTLRVLLAFASSNNWTCDHMDVVTAFLHPKIDQENIHMKLPELHDLGDLTEFGLSNESRTVLLKKALYGLKQSPRLWHQEINSFLNSLGFEQSTADPNLYLTSTIMILLYVDDLQLFYKAHKEVVVIKEKLKRQYKMVDLGTTKRFLGMNINRTEQGYSLHQTPYIENLLQRHNMTDAYGVDTPIDTHVTLEITKDDEDRPVDQTTYLAMVGSLMYAAQMTRPDICYAVGLLSRFNTNPRTRHLTAAKRVLRYLKKTKNKKLTYTNPNSNLHGFVDADWANSSDRKSVGGYVYLLNNTAISWSSKKQSLVALSTKEAEYTAFTEASREALWLRRLLQDIEKHEPETTTIFADNQAAIKHTTTEGITARTKHFDTQLRHSRDLQQKRIVNFTYVKSENNTADLLTKGLPAPAHRRHVERLGLKEAVEGMGV